MTSTAWTLIISLAGVLISALISTFIAGMHTGSIKTDITYMKRDITEIRQLFTLTLPMASQNKDNH